MLSLAELQQSFHGAILGGAPDDISITGTLSLAEALSVHRDTAIGGLVNALRLSYPTVDVLVGEQYFDQIAVEYALTQPPRHGALDGYGAAFVGFLEGYPSAQGLPYLGDVARLDRTVEHVIRHSNTARTIALDSQVRIQVPASVTVLELAYPAHEIREALGDDMALAAINMETGARRVVIWRQDDFAVVRAIRAPAAAFLIALLDGTTPEAAIRRAGGDSAEILSLIQNDIFAAPFCAVMPLEENGI